VSTQTASMTLGSDTSSDVERVVEATRHLHRFRQGFAELLVRIAEESTQFLHDNAIAHIEPALRILGDARAERMAERLYRIACDVTTDDPRIDKDIAALCLRKVADEAAHAVADAFHQADLTCLDCAPRKSRP
jgi:hypothetical protein